MPTGNPGIPNPRKRPYYRDIPSERRCRVALETGNFYRWSKRCHRVKIKGTDVCAHHQEMSSEGMELRFVKDV